MGYDHSVNINIYMIMILGACITIFSRFVTSAMMLGSVIRRAFTGQSAMPATVPPTTASV